MEKTCLQSMDVRLQVFCFLGYKGNVKQVLKVSDIPNPGTTVPGAMFGLEGGDALEGRISRVDEFYRQGVRIITVVHYRNNEIGDIMKVRPGS